MRNYKNAEINSLLEKFQKPKNALVDLAKYLEWKASFRPYQFDCMNNINGKEIGHIQIPTGMGKTWIQAGVISDDMIEKNKSGKLGVYGIGAHRLALCEQLLDDLVKYAVLAGMEFDIIFVGSSCRDKNYYINHVDYQKYNLQIDTTLTLNEKEVVNAVALAKERGRHVIIVSTYHSVSKLNLLDNIDIFTCDEAHKLEDYKIFKKNFAIIANLESKIIKRKFFFTATLVEGMEDPFYGELLYHIPPVKGINMMEILMPQIQQIDVDYEEVPGESDAYCNTRMMLKAITQGYLKHAEVLARMSAEPDKIAAKLMVCFEWQTKLMKSVYNSQEFKDFCKENGIKAIMFSSSPKTPGYWVDFQRTDRLGAMRALKSLDNEEGDKQKAIFFHIDILSEGINLPSITAILPFRKMDKVKLTQTAGRAARLCRLDKKRFYSGEIDESEVQLLMSKNPDRKCKLIKPVFTILIPKFYETIEPVWMDKLIKEIYNTYQTIYIHLDRDIKPVGKQVVDGGIIDIDDPIEGKSANINQVIKNAFANLKEQEVNSLPLTIDDFAGYIEAMKLNSGEENAS